MSLAFTADSPRLAYWRVGEQGAPVLLIMGFGMRGLVWQPQVEGLRDTHRVVYFDNRGIGDSEPGPQGRWTMRLLAEDARRVLDAAGFAQAHVVGVSMGGMIAQELALQHPERVLSLSLIATHAGGVAAMLPKLRGLWFFLRANIGGPAARLRALPQLLYPAEFLARPESSSVGSEVTRQVSLRAARPVVLRQLLAVLRHDTRRRLANLGVPTLIVRPARDILVRPSGSDGLARRIPAARVLALDDAGHGVTFQCAASLNQALREHFVVAIERRRPG